MVNAGKNPMFTTEQRFEMLCAATAELDNVTAELWTGLLADYARERGARWLVKGARSGTDFDSEFAMAQINRGLDAELDTVLLPARAEFLHFSSSMVREMIRYKRPLEPCMPAAAIRMMKGWDNNG
jgi:pantetheine-phosphate adenylyltransferase